MQEFLVPGEETAAAGPLSPPSHGRTGNGVASIVPHLYRQQRINDKPSPNDPWLQSLPGPERAERRR